MTQHITISISWEGMTSKEVAKDIANQLNKELGYASQLHTESAIGGLELVAYTIVIAIAAKLGDKLADRIADAIWKSLGKLLGTKSKSSSSAATIEVEWHDGKARLFLVLDDPSRIKAKLAALVNLIDA